MSRSLLPWRLDLAACFRWRRWKQIVISAPCHSNFNPRSRKLKVDGHRHTLISEFDVKEILGYRALKTICSIIRWVHWFGGFIWNDLKRGPLTVAHLKGYWSSCHRGVIWWCSPFMPFAMVLCRTIKPNCSANLPRFVVDAEATERLNRAKFMLDWLCEEVNKFQIKKQTSSCGCILLLVVRNTNVLISHY